jgi:transcription initiation factor TFIID subunit 7
MKLKFSLDQPKGEGSEPASTPAPSEQPTQTKVPKISFKKKTATPATAAPAAEAPKPKRQYNKKPKPDQTEGSPEAVKKTPGRKRKIKTEEDEGNATPPAKKPKSSGIRLNLTGKLNTGLLADTAQPQAPTRQVPKLRISSGQKLSLQQRSESVTHLRVKAKGKPPPRPVGVGYDSEGEDIEVDPAIESQVILSFIVKDDNGDASYMRKMIDERKVGLKVTEGGADIAIRFLGHSDGRRALVIIRGRKYAALLVDLPCVIESMKSWDRKAWWKVADVSQKLMILGVVNTDEEAMKYPIPPEVDAKHWLYPHGLTPPMKWVRKRRFRHNVNYRRIEEVESAVQTLLEKDQARRNAGWQVTHEWIEPGQDLEQEDEEMEEQGAEFDETYGDGMELEQAEVELDAEGEDDLARLMQEGFGEATVELTMSPSANTPSATIEHRLSQDPMLQTAITSDSGVTPASQEETGDEALESGDEDDGEVDEDDEEEKARQEELAEQREEIEDLRREIAAFEEQAQKQANPMLKKRAQDKAKSLKAELELKLSGLGEDEEEE